MDSQSSPFVLYLPSNFEYLQEKCRICLAKKQNMVPILNNIELDGKVIPLQDILKAISVIKVGSNDKKPKLICTECKKKAIISYKFITACETSDQKLENDIILNKNGSPLNIDENNSSKLKNWTITTPYENGNYTISIIDESNPRSTQQMETYNNQSLIEALSDQESKCDEEEQFFFEGEFEKVVVKDEAVDEDYTSDLNYDMDSNLDDDFTCALCENNFETKEELLNHLEEEHIKYDGEDEEENVENEEYEHIIIQNDTGDTDSNVEITVNVPSKNKYHCPHCGKMFPRRYNLLRHKKTAKSCPGYEENHEQVATLLKEKSDDEDIENDLAFQRILPLIRRAKKPTVSTSLAGYGCPACGKMFVRRFNVIRHLKTTQCYQKNDGADVDEEMHQGMEMDLETTPDDNVEKLITSIKIIKRATVSKQKTSCYTCPSCGKGFKRRFNVIRHLKTTKCFSEKHEKNAPTEENSFPTSIMYLNYPEESFCDQNRVPTLNQRKMVVKVNTVFESTVQSFESKVFQSHFGISKKIVYDLIDELRHSDIYIREKKHGKAPISAEKTFLFGMWYLSNNETFREISNRFGVSLSSGHKLLTQVADFLISKAKTWIKLPSDREKVQFANHFKRDYNIDRVVGIINACHIKIGKPRNPDCYFNRKSYYSLLLQGLVSHTGLFMDVFCGEPGSLDNVTLLTKSKLYEKGQNNQLFGDFIVIGNSSYPNLSWLISPYEDNDCLSQEHFSFNEKLLSTQVITDNAFGLLKGRFKRLGYLSNSDLMLAAKLIMSTCILHNICIIRNDDTQIQMLMEENPNKQHFNEEMFPNVPVHPESRDLILQKIFCLGFLGTEIFICDFCGNGFSQEDYLLQHINMKHRFLEESKEDDSSDINIDHPKSDLECKYCTYLGSNKDKLWRHMSSEHEHFKTIKCTLCPKKFFEEKRLKDHMNVHVKPKNHVCNFCGVAFLHSFNLKSHIRIHTGEKPYKCDNCDLTFGQYNSLKSHRITVHDKAYNFVCDSCGAAFKRLQEFKIHERRHLDQKPFACKFCNKSFVTSYELKLHSELHLQYKIFCCEICNKKFRSINKYESHALIHELDMHESQ